MIIANNVLANISNLDDIFKGIKKILNRNGFLIIETFSLYGILKNNLVDNIYHEHLSYFTISSFEKFAKKYDFYLSQVKFLKIKGGSLRFIFKNSKLKKNKNIINCIKKENKVLKNMKKKFFKLRVKNNQNSFKMNTLVNNLISQKKEILGFGASVGTTTLIYDFKLEKKVDFLFDNEKRRHNLFCPGTKIKVLSPSLLNKYTYEYVIIFAWRYAKIIIERNKKYFKKGTKFVVPLPNFSIFK